MDVLVLNPPYFPKFSRPQRSPAVTKSGTLYFPIWLAYCTGVLEAAGHSVRLLDAPATGQTLDDVLAVAQTEAPRLIVMDTCTPSIEHDRQVAAALRKILPDAFIVMVGTHVSALADETLKQTPAINAVARREYEFTIRELADALQHPDGATDTILRGIAGLSFRAGDALIHNPDRPYLEDLNSLPWVSKVYQKHLDITRYFNPNALFPMVTLISSRGCPFRCSFCVYPQTFTGRTFRFRSLADIVDEMEYVTQAFPHARSIFFEDDTLTANKKRCLALAEAILERNIKISWTTNSRIELDLETLKHLARAGCRQLCVGFESGDQRILDAMGKGTKIEHMHRFMRDAREAGMLIHGCFILGFPEDTPESVEKTIQLAIDLNPAAAQFYPVMVYPGTEAFEEYRSKKWLTAQHYSDWLTPDGLHNCVVRNDHFSSADLVRLCDQARRRFYLRPRYMVSRLYQSLRQPDEFIRTAKAGRIFLRHLIFGSRV